MPQGVIKKIVSDRGFGFIAGNPEDIFFHHSSVVDYRFDDLKEGQTVVYEIAEADARRKGKGPRAASVRPVE
ncbi:MAG: cold-shock protein [Thermoguttaceae bacterium]